MRIDIPLLYRLLTFPPLNALSVLLASVGALVTAYVAQYFFDVLPCTLCYWQRVPYAIAAVLSGVALVVWLRCMFQEDEKVDGQTHLPPCGGGNKILGLRLRKLIDFIGGGSKPVGCADPHPAKSKDLLKSKSEILLPSPQGGRLGVLAMTDECCHPLIRLLLALCAAAFFVNAGIAFFHSGVELKWWAGTDTCGVNPDVFKDIASAREMLLKTPAVRCDEINFTVFGFTMANWNVLAGLGLGLFAALGAWRRR